ncbi:MAG: DUF4136 domain-containing protein [Candidatus Krumholzibacteria bacterium]|nr:DUF4136 domain-containing protein [Candidatus Krumholzibacteria bacterium]
MKRSAIIVALTAIIFITGCSTVQVETDYNRETDFSKYKTYRWIPHVKGTEDNPLMNDPLIEGHVKNAVNTEMAKKGFTKIEEGHPDCLLAYYFTARNRVDVTHHYGYWYPHTNVYQYKEGTLILDIVDREDKQLIWRGWATGVLEDRSRINDQINYSVQKLLKKYPPNSRKEGTSW